MQVLFVHPNYPAQFGPLAGRLVREEGVECAFVSKVAEGERDGLRCVRFRPRGGASKSTHYCSRTFENAVWHAHAVHEACERTPWLRPDVIVGHSGFGTTCYLPELYDAPIVNLFEYWYTGRGSDMDFRPEFPPRPLDYLRSRTRNAMILTDLATCAVGYAPTRWQRSLFPEPWRERLEVVHDGIDVDLWRRPPDAPRVVAGEALPDGARIVTFVSRGLEAMRGFDVFVRLAQRLAGAHEDLLFVVVGEDRTHYGNDLRHVSAPSFREHVLVTERPDLARFRFLGRVPREELAALLAISDLHVYLTVPFVLSWSLLDAMASECAVLASDVAPVREFVEDGANGALAPFDDLDALAARAEELLADPDRRRALGRAARATVVERCSLEAVWPLQRALLERAMGRA